MKETEKGFVMRLAIAGLYVAAVGIVLASFTVGWI